MALTEGREGRRFAFHALAAAAPAAGAALSLAVAFFAAWLATRGTDALRMLFAPLGLGEPNPSEAFKRITYGSFFAAWTVFFGLWFGWAIRRRGIIKAIVSDTRQRRTAVWFAAFSCLPLVFVPLLFLFGVEGNYYAGERPLWFDGWMSFQQFKKAPIFSVSASLVLAASWWMTAKREDGHRFVEATACLLFLVTVCLMSVRIGLFPPPDGFVTDFDTHHKSSVLEPLVRHFVTGLATFSQYGGYYAFGGTFARFATALGVDPFAAVQWFFVLSVGTAFAAFGLSLRLASGSWLPAFAALAAALAFAAIPARGMLYLQVEPLRWLFPSLGMLAIALASPPLAAGRYLVTLPLFVIAFAALKWNPETGIAMALALSLATVFVSSPRTLKDAVRLAIYAGSGLALGWIAAKSMSLASSPLWPAVTQEVASTAASSETPTSPLFPLAVFLKGVFVHSAPVFHAWLAMGFGAVWFVSFAATRLSLGRISAVCIKETRLLGLLLYVGSLFLLMLFYYVNLSVPGTLMALSYPFFAGSALSAHAGLKHVISPGGRRVTPFAFGAITAAIPLLILTPLLPQNAAGGGHSYGYVNSSNTSTTRGVCAFADKYARGGDILYLGQNDWWYELSCNRVFNDGLAPQALVISDILHKEWIKRLKNASVVFHEADLVQSGNRDYGRYGPRILEYQEILNNEFTSRVEIKDWNGRRIFMYVKESNEISKPIIQPN